MKRIIFVVILLAILMIGCTSTPVTQINPNRNVVMELFSANWCSNCPNAEFALDKAVNNDSVIGIVYHPTTNDTFGTTETDARFSYYSLTTSQTPEMVINGRIKILGAEDTTIYNAYKNAFLSEDSTHVPVEISIDTISVTDSSIYAGIRIENIDTFAVNYTLRALLIENAIRYTAQNGETLHQYVARKFFPDENGTSVSVLAGGMFDTTINQNCSMLHPSMQGALIVFVQDDSSKEVIQGTIKNFAISQGDTTPQDTTDTTFLYADAPLNDTLALGTEEYIHIIVDNIRTDSVYSMQVTVAPFADSVTDWVNCAFGMCYLSDTNGMTFPAQIDTITPGTKDTCELHITYGNDPGEGRYIFRIKKESDMFYTDSLIITRVAN